MAQTKGTGRIHNAVHDDAIWRQTIRYEATTADTWEKNWGFMREEYAANSRDSLNKASGNKLQLPPIDNATQQQQQAHPSIFPSRRAHLVDETNEDYIMSYQIDWVKRQHTVREKYSFPPTRAYEYGWSWHSQPLERFGQHAKGQRNITRWWGGATESLH